MPSEALNVTPLHRDMESQLATEERKTFTIDKHHLRNQNIFVENTDEEAKIAISAYKSMRTNVLREMHRRAISTIMVTGTTKDVGKTTTAVNLALSIAKHVEKRVVLVDFDLRKPSFGSVFNVAVNYGVDSIMDPDFSIAKAMLYPDLRRLFLLPCAKGHTNSTEILMSAQMRQLIRLLRNYDENHIVIFDTPPLLGCDDVAAISSIMDACLLVVSEGETSRSELREAVSALDDLPIIATVMNRATEAKFDQYYY